MELSSFATPSESESVARAARPPPDSSVSQQAMWARSGFTVRLRAPPVECSGRRHRRLNPLRTPQLVVPYAVSKSLQLSGTLLA